MKFYSRRFAKQLLLLLYFNCIITCWGESDPVIKILEGTLQGILRQTVRGKTFASFTGIPYAKPPVCDLRFQMPVPVDPWNGTFDATKAHSICPQSRAYYDNPEIYGIEDCLYLNVYTPIMKQQASNSCSETKPLLPVMIFFKGLAFITGSANFKSCNPSILLDKQIVLVIPNYRLGALGFFSSGDEIIPGNNGLKDQNLAIKWVKRNIEFFGGDPDKITLFGQSSGAASAHFHMFSEMSKNLIDRVICESGTAFAPWALSRNEHTQINSRLLAKTLGCPTMCSNEMVACLREVQMNDILMQQDRLFYKWDMEPMAPFRPVIEPLIKEAFLTEEPRDLLRADRTAKVPLIIGINLAEGAFRASSIYGYPELFNDFKENFYEIVPVALYYDDLIAKPRRATNSIKNYYFENMGRGCSNFSKTALTNMYTDALFLLPIHLAVELHFNYTSERVYFYAFDYRGTISKSQNFGDLEHNYGSCHGDELLYLFDYTKSIPNYKPSEDDKRMTAFLSNLWTSFADTGYPIPKKSCSPIKWKSVSSSNYEYLSINNTRIICMEKELLSERLRFWKAWYDKYVPNFAYK